MSEENWSPIAYVQRLMAELSKGQNHFLLSYAGTKSPRGAQIDGVKIGWAHNGIIVAENGESLGSYKRIEGPGGDSGPIQTMLISTNGKDLTPPPGGGFVEKVEHLKSLPLAPEESPTLEDVSKVLQPKQR